LNRSTCPGTTTPRPKARPLSSLLCCKASNTRFEAEDLNFRLDSLPSPPYNPNGLVREEDKAFVISRITAETEDGKPSKALKKRAKAWRDLINQRAADIEVGVDFWEAVGVID